MDVALLFFYGLLYSYKITVITLQDSSPFVFLLQNFRVLPIDDAVCLMKRSRSSIFGLKGCRMLEFIEEDFHFCVFKMKMVRKMSKKLT